MKKKFLFFLPLIAITACSGNCVETFKPFIDYKSGVPCVHLDSSDHVTYLMMSKYGSLKTSFSEASIKGEVSELFYENTIIWTALEGTPLPTKEEVISSVKDATFRGWAYYDEENSNVYPDYYTTVPKANGLALKAIFDGTDAGGGGGDTPTEEGYGLIFGDGTKIKAQPKGMSAYGKDEYLCPSVKFTTGSMFSLYDFSTKATWTTTVNTWSFGGTSDTDTKWQSYIKNGGSTWTVQQNFTADVYIQLQFNNDTIFFELK